MATSEDEWLQNMQTAWNKAPDVGSTHFENCELSHKDCAIRELMSGMGALLKERRKLLQLVDALQEISKGYMLLKERNDKMREQWDRIADRLKKAGIDLTKIAE